MTEAKKLNLRLPPDLHAALLELAAHECTSANAVTIAALRNWIEYRSRRLPARAGLQATTLKATKGSPVSQVAKVGANQPCPCGSGQKYKRCHGKA